MPIAKAQSVGHGEYTLCQHIRSTLKWAYHLLCAFCFVEGNGMNEGVVVERRQVRILCLDVHHHGMMVCGQCNLAWAVVVKVGKGNLVFCAQRGADDQLVDVVELVPILVRFVHVAV